MSEILSRHPNTCHHCGFFAIPADVRCTECGLQGHATCLPGLASAGSSRCDACRVAALPRCALCGQADPEGGPRDSVARLVRVVAYHGRRWEARRRRPRLRHARCGARIAARLEEDPEAVFLPEELPERGRRRMLVERGEGRGFFVSVPFVVHTWCAHALFGVVPHRSASWIADLLRGMEEADAAYARAEAGRGQRACGGGVCRFCGGDQGYVTFCAFHCHNPAGCRTCSPREGGYRYTSRAFHPSCAVRAGMLRLVRGRAIHGLICPSRRAWLATRPMALVFRPWIGLQSGVNETLREAFTSLLPEDFVEGTENLPRLGSGRW